MSYNPPKDNENRSGRGIAVTLSPDKDGKTKVILDDIQYQNRLGDGRGWEHSCIFTTAEFGTVDLEQLQVDRKQLEKLAEDILIRLLVLNQRNKDG